MGGPDQMYVFDPNGKLQDFPEDADTANHYKPQSDMWLVWLVVCGVGFLVSLWALITSLMDPAVLHILWVFPAISAFLFLCVGIWVWRDARKV